MSDEIIDVMTNDLRMLGVAVGLIASINIDALARKVDATELLIADNPMSSEERTSFVDSTKKIRALIACARSFMSAMPDELRTQLQSNPPTDQGAS